MSFCNDFLMTETYYFLKAELHKSGEIQDAIRLFKDILKYDPATFFTIDLMIAMV